MLFLLDKKSEFAKFSAQTVFFIVDISELTSSAFTYDESVSVIDNWFSTFNYCIDKKKQYFVSDVVFRTKFSEDLDEMLSARIETYWLTKIYELMNKHTNIHRFPLRDIVIEMGRASFFSDKLWYMGKIPFTSGGCKLLAEKILLQVNMLKRTPKKVLVLDLDNTLWGGVVGELGIEGIQLSDDGIGAIYRDSQRIIKQMQQHGVILAINSKNNWSDAIEIIQKHPHMVLREQDFATMRINWATKPENLQELARELNLGLDSFVFIDDMPSEKEAVNSLLPMVEVPDSPKSMESLPIFFGEIYNTFFKKLNMTANEFQEKAFEIFRTSDADSLLPVVRFSFPPQRGVVVKDNLLNLVSPEYLNTRSQDLEPMYHDCGQFSIVNTEAFLKNGKIIMDKTATMIIPELEVQDIDNEEDWKLAEMKYKMMINDLV